MGNPRKRDAIRRLKPQKAYKVLMRDKLTGQLIAPVAGYIFHPNRWNSIPDCEGLIMCHRGFHSFLKLTDARSYGRWEVGSDNYYTVEIWECLIAGDIQDCYHGTILTKTGVVSAYVYKTLSRHMKLVRRVA